VSIALLYINKIAGKKMERYSICNDPQSQKYRCIFSKGKAYYIFILYIFDQSNIWIKFLVAKAKENLSEGILLCFKNMTGSKINNPVTKKGTMYEPHTQGS
jgi:hypothetical protein